MNRRTFLYGSIATSLTTPLVAQAWRPGKVPAAIRLLDHQGYRVTLHEREPGAHRIY